RDTLQTDTRPWSLRLQDLMTRKDVADKATLPGVEVYDLYQTYGFPLELTEEIAGERGLRVDHAGYIQARHEHERVSGTGATVDVFKTSGDPFVSLGRELPSTRFVGYESTACRSTVLAIVHDGDSVEIARARDQIQVVLDETPFYAEAGGQIGDCGT